MSKTLKLMAVLAHPDDESLGMGGTFVRYGREGVDCSLVTATRGERGRYGDLPERPSLEEVGRIREAELRCAAEKLGIGRVSFLDYIDGDLDKADPAEAAGKIARHIREFRPQVVLTFGPEGAYGHPDHIAISQFTTAAIVLAASNDFEVDGQSDQLHPHCIDKLYFMAWDKKVWDAYQAAFKDLVIKVDDTERRATPAPDWLVTTRYDTTPHWQQVWEAVNCHKTQLAIYDKLRSLPEEYHRAIWGSQQFYRVFSTVNGGRSIENDLFEGLRANLK